jgi:hypothetical protein
MGAQTPASVNTGAFLKKIAVTDEWQVVSTIQRPIFK